MKDTCLFASVSVAAIAASLAFIFVFHTLVFVVLFFIPFIPVLGRMRGKKT